MHQQLTLIGNLGADVEIRSTADGTTVGNFKLAVSEKWRNQDGSPGEKTIWFDVAVFGEHAKTHAKYVHKGSRIFLSGRISGVHTWLDMKDGSPRGSVQVKADVIKYLSSNTSQDEPASQQKNDDIPF